MEYVRFSPPHLLGEYAGMPGYEIGGTALGMRGLDALVVEKATKQRELVVIGQYRYDDGRFFLDFGVPTAWIEEHSSYVLDDGTRRLRLFCRECEGWDGHHGRACSRRG